MRNRDEGLHRAGFIGPGVKGWSMAARPVDAGIDLGVVTRRLCRLCKKQL